MQETLRALRDQIRAFLSAPDDGFEDLAWRIFEFQFTYNAPYHAFCKSLGTTPTAIRSWDEIPPVPADGFKGATPLSCLPANECERIFLTSGTTAEHRGRHFLADTVLYETSVREGWNRADLPRGLPSLFLSRSPAAAPDSSLACMFGYLADERSPWLLTEEGSIEIGPLEEACSAGKPVLLFSTALAFRHFFEQFPEQGPLPPGSWAFHTGGYKGVSETYRPSDLYETIESQLAVPAERVINEYGMTELSSPSYSVGLDHPHRTPPWLKVRSIHPETNQPSQPGELGHLVFCDLANLNSVAALRTEDLGTVLDEHTFVLAGRDPTALPRGCSRASDAFLQNP